MDIVFIAGMLVLVALTCGFAIGCAGLEGGKP